MISVRFRADVGKKRFAVDSNGRTLDRDFCCMLQHDRIAFRS